MVDGLVSSDPSWLASRAFVPGGSRSFAFATPCENET
jgi:hypothetical protein